MWGTPASFDGQSTDFVEVVAIAAFRALVRVAPERVPIATAVSVIVRWHDHPVRIERDTAGPPHEIGHRWTLDELRPLGRELGATLRERAAGNGVEAARAAHVLRELPALV